MRPKLGGLARSGWGWWDPHGPPEGPLAGLAGQAGGSGLAGHLRSSADSWPTRRCVPGHRTVTTAGINGVETGLVGAVPGWVRVGYGPGMVGTGYVPGWVYRGPPGPLAFPGRLNTGSLAGFTRLSNPAERDCGVPGDPEPFPHRPNNQGL